jgi:uncharacterized BrkB/YihY/UPF0761 family membrane protein
MLGQRAAYVLKHPGVFAIQVLKSFRANQGLLLAGAVAYYALLSIQQMPGPAGGSIEATP